MDQDETWHGGSHQLRPYCVKWKPSSPSGTASIFGPCRLWPKGWMDQDATLYGSRFRPRRHCVTWDPNPSPSKKGAEQPHFSAHVLRPSGWMHQGATWCEDRPRPRPHCVRWRPNSPTGAQQPPIFWPILMWLNGWVDQDATWYEVGLGPGYIVLDDEPAPPPQKRGTQQPPPFGRCLLWPNGRPSQLLLSSCYITIANVKFLPDGSLTIFSVLERQITNRPTRSVY